MDEKEVLDKWYKIHILTVSPSGCTEHLMEMHFEVIGIQCIYYAPAYLLDDMKTRRNDDELHAHRWTVMSAVMYFVNREFENQARLALCRREVVEE